jgi:prepilin-type N-terminal cleavage/methylation domain-containing protein/prepilin-type processing-associated H-X9-DG protein
MKLRLSQRRRTGFTMVELLVVIVIIAVLATLTFVGVNRARDATNRASSIANLRQLGIGMVTFTADNNGYLPASRVGTTFWPQVIYPYVPSPAVFVRPGSKNVPMDAAHPNGYFSGVDAKTLEGQPIRWNYVINGGGAKLPFCEFPDNPNAARGLARSISTVEQPDRTVFLADGTSWWLNAEAKPDSKRMYRWKNGSSNVLFGDGSTRNLNCKTDLVASQFLVD